jgi:hypothetical protein
MNNNNGKLVLGLILPESQPCYNLAGFKNPMGHYQSDTATPNI